ncbi:MAG: large subunit ribosomal protein L17 [Parcubacteria group bacterium Athens1014_10]|nr:MAG: large subunit ribosomal protein L17 [Parcubacteria group bacterium Athens1014_10]TSD06054.1 MAG: large subunit ribosomal protein L17 [Parcubacteria group bacterium Athens0714_12]
MRHQNKGKILDRKKAARNSLFRNLVASLITHKKIKTTLAKAKAIRTLAEKSITLGKKNTLSNRRRLLAYLPEKVVIKIISEISPSYKDRKGGYTRIVKIGARLGDRAEMAQIELIS